jgi:hypothetical protein
LCFSSFQLLKENFHGVINQHFHSCVSEHGENNGLTDGNYLPLCFASFKLLRENFETINEVEKCGLMQSHLDSMGKIDNELQKSPLVFHDPVVDYIEDINSQNLQLLANYQSGNKDDKDLVLQTTSFSCSTRVSLQRFYEDFQYFHDNHQWDLHRVKNAVEGLIQDGCFMHYFQDPFVVFLDSTSRLKLLNFVKVESVRKFLLKMSSNRFLFLFLEECMQGIEFVDKVLAWLHWIFDFT